eukprot:TRINITY_DN5797_c0_g1_i2.p1 TRINITY_DN5797_c0_g1~~TRINITY_DN5797_c0_g1_i2.p1  ORF type:complete len:319 (-),score=8.19 TRINITY_DN5797_c0_g1_i2:79-1035(-)
MTDEVKSVICLVSIGIVSLCLASVLYYCSLPIVDVYIGRELEALRLNLESARANVRQTHSDTALEENEGKLIILWTDRIGGFKTHQDPLFKVWLSGFEIQRDVEYCMWVKTLIWFHVLWTSEDVGPSDTTGLQPCCIPKRETIESYHLKGFEPVNIGNGYVLAPHLIAQGNYTPDVVEFISEELQDFESSEASVKGFHYLRKGIFYLQHKLPCECSIPITSPCTPGDIRVRFRDVHPYSVTVLAKQIDNKGLLNVTEEYAFPIGIVHDGIHDLETMLSREHVRLDPTQRYHNSWYATLLFISLSIVSIYSCMHCEMFI